MSSAEKGNVLVIGNSGVGKSTLINAVMGEKVAKTGWGTSGTTKRLEIYEPKQEDVPFRIIDTVGFEPSYVKRKQAIRAVQKWSAESMKEGESARPIHVIWFCVEGTSGKLFPQAIRNLMQATTMWESVPVIVVITKSYSIPDRKPNIDMVHQAFASVKRYGNNLKAVIPVVAEPFFLDETTFAVPDGISELISATNDLMPEGQRAAEKDISRFVLGRKRVLAHSVVTACAAGSAVVGAVPLGFPDALVLAPTEIAEVNAIARIYGIDKGEKAKRFLNSIVEAGTVSMAAKGFINALKNIPGVNLAASVLNAVIAGIMVVGLGEAAIFAFEQIYLGNRTLDDIDWVKRIVESKLTLVLAEKAQAGLSKLNDTSGRKEIFKVVTELVSTALGGERGSKPKGKE